MSLIHWRHLGFNGNANEFNIYHANTGIYIFFCKLSFLKNKHTVFDHIKLK